MLFLGTLLLYVYEQQVHKKLKQLRKLKQQLLFVLSGTGTVGCDVGFNNILDFSTSIDGIKYKVGSEILKRYSRVRQSLNNGQFQFRPSLDNIST